MRSRLASKATIDVVVTLWHRMECLATGADEPIEVMGPVCTKMGKLLWCENAENLNYYHNTRVPVPPYAFEPVSVPENFEDCKIAALGAVRCLSNLCSWMDKEESRALDLLDELESRLLKHFNVDQDKLPDWMVYLQERKEYGLEVVDRDNWYLKPEDYDYFVSLFKAECPVGCVHDGPDCKLEHYGPTQE